MGKLAGLLREPPISGSISGVPFDEHDSMNMIQRIFALTAVAALSVATSPYLHAQAGGGNNNQTTSLIGQPIAGIDVDATGVLRVKQFDPRVAVQRFEAAKAQRGAGEANVMQPSKLRKISLNRLEAAIADRMAAGQSIEDEMKALAGLTAVEYVFYYPETQDIVIAGPAEGFFADPTDRLIGMETGRPVVLLEDMVTAMRAYAPGQKATSVISVSIDPTTEGLQAMQNFLSSVRGRVQPSDANRLAMGLKNNLGLQTVTFQGIPTDTHFARVLVEADYRMKLVGIGLEKLPVRLQSYVDRASPASVAANAMERWYFQPNYDGVAVSEDGLAMKIKERGVQLVGANERVAAGGQRVKGGRVNAASQAFCRDFTENFNLIASRVRIYGELRQLIDVAIAAAYIQEQDFYGQASWDASVLMDESKVSVETYTSPEQVETAVNAIWKGNTLMTPLGGGVQMQPRIALSKENLKIDANGENVQAKQSAGPADLANGQWWWD
ncbi:hypothetical protein Poly51_17990 [Rubripirellula tenax]|uniref:DUF1598 domain-containing protein n=2 Tax=Rubripirellula tenax TaxID=2528015 RepID=A0A5C6FFL8_9BACT|nr:hypothetical protein Poly51_17990 [Rubripirellula tenax]